jgi:plastocyanin
VRLRKRYLSFATALGAMGVLLPAIASSASPTETVQALAPYSWSPASATVSTGGSLTFKNESGINHGIIWTGGTAGATPSCNTQAGDNIPLGAGNWSTSWSGSCTFAKAGTYTYECSYHMALMRGTITVTTVGVPLAGTAPATAVGETEATLAGTVDPEGKATTYFFNYGTSASYGLKTGEQSAGEEKASKSVSIPVSSLAPGTIYHFQLVAKNSAGTTFGEDATFTTASPPGAPAAVTGLATALSETQATLNGTVNPDGLATSYFFEWGTGGSYGQKTAELSAGEDHSSHAVSATLSGLAPGETYDFRIVAKNSSGPSSIGGAQSFTTVATPVTPPVTPPTTPTTPVATTSTQPSGGAPPVTTPGPGPRTPLPGIAPTLALASTQHGAAVHGAVQIPAADAGARLEVELLAARASLAKAKRSSRLRVGRLVRSAAPAGSVSFTVALDAAAKRALRHRHKLALTARIVLTPAHDAAVTIARSVLLRP